MDNLVPASVAFYTLGCKLNFSETSTIARIFVEAGYVKVSHTFSADIYVISTCSVTEHADKKCRNVIRKLHKRNPNALIVVTGCYAQLKPEEILNIVGVDMVLGCDHKDRLFMKVAETHKKGCKQSFSCEISEVESIFPAYSLDDRTRSFLKIQDGCDYKCTYCTIPLARGKSRSLPVEIILREAMEIAANGIKEIVLTGVNTGDFGRGTGESFIDLLKALNEVEGIERYRISSIEPNLLTDEIIQWISSVRKFLPHFHIPLQSGSDKILALMKRRYNSSLFRERVAQIRKHIPFSFLGVDVIAGFPGETEADFIETCDFLMDILPSFIHVFPYSKRANTPAAIYCCQVPETEKKKRVDILTRLSDELYKSFIIANKGREEEVLFESAQKGGKMFGYTGNYIRIEASYNKNMIGRIVPIKI